MCKTFWYISFGLCTALFFFSCDGRITKAEALKKSIADYSNGRGFKTTTIHPEFYAEKEVDTLLSNGFNVQLKTFTDMETYLHWSETKQNQIIDHHFRVIKCELEVAYKENLVYTSLIDKTFIIESLNANDYSLKDYNIKSIWVDQSASLDKNLLCLKIELTSVTTKSSLFFSLQINKNGVPYLTEIN